MPGRVELGSRKEPTQSRSRQMRSDILEAAIRVLRREGALRFTTWRIAETAGVSVGSLYQYFPNKEAIIFAIHSEQVDRTWKDVQTILDHPRWTPRRKVRAITELFFLVEAQEVSVMGSALRDAEIYFANQPEYQALWRDVLARLAQFVRKALKGRVSRAEAAVRARFMAMAIENFGQTVARMGLGSKATLTWARQCAEAVSECLGL
jgi:AcrR family transcriptional regulator